MSIPIVERSATGYSFSGTFSSKKGSRTLIIRLLYFDLYSVNNIFIGYLTIQTRSEVLKKHILTTFNKLDYLKRS